VLAGVVVVAGVAFAAAVEVAGGSGFAPHAATASASAANTGFQIISLCYEICCRSASRAATA